MTCKLSHDEDGLPKFLCRECNPDAFKSHSPVSIDADAPEVDPAMRAKIVKHRIAKLRKEEKRLSKLIDDLHFDDHANKRRLYEAIKAVEKDIDRERARL